MAGLRAQPLRGAGARDAGAATTCSSSTPTRSSRSRPASSCPRSSATPTTYESLYGGCSYIRRQLVSNSLPWRYERRGPRVPPCASRRSTEELPGAPHRPLHDGARARDAGHLPPRRARARDARSSRTRRTRAMSSTSPRATATLATSSRAAQLPAARRDGRVERGASGTRSTRRLSCRSAWASLARGGRRRADRVAVRAGRGPRRAALQHRHALSATARTTSSPTPSSPVPCRSTCRGRGPPVRRARVLRVPVAARVCGRGFYVGDHAEAVATNNACCTTGKSRRRQSRTSSETVASAWMRASRPSGAERWAGCA